MDDPVKKLQDDHRRLLEVLLRFDQTLQRCGDRREQQAAVARLVEALEYIQGYPERWHHPVEQLAFKCLARKCDEIAVETERLLQEHDVLEEQTCDLQLRFRDCLDNGLAPDGRLLKSAYDYLHRQLRHQKRENERIFPLLTTLLDASDWHRIEQQLLEAPRNQTLRQHYLTVFNRLVHGPPPQAPGAVAEGDPRTP